MTIVDAGSLSHEINSDVEKYDKLKKDAFNILFVAHKKHSDAYFKCGQILLEGEKEIAKARAELKNCVDHYNETVAQANRNRELMRQVGQGLQEAMKQLDPMEKKIAEHVKDAEKMLSINKNHAALTASLAASKSAKIEMFRVGEKANGIALECKDVKSYTTTSV